MNIGFSLNFHGSGQTKRENGVTELVLQIFHKAEVNRASKLFLLSIYCAQPVKLRTVKQGNNPNYDCTDVSSH